MTSSINQNPGAQLHLIISARQRDRIVKALRLLDEKEPFDGEGLPEAAVFGIVELANMLEDVEDDGTIHGIDL